MTELTLNLSKKEVTRNYITQLLEQLTFDYKNTKEERKKLASLLSTSEEEFTVLEELELLTTKLRGYASQIQVRGGIDNSQAVVEQLQEMQFFAIDAIAQFYFTTNAQYPQLKAYIRSLDYLRLLIIEYLLG